MNSINQITEEHFLTKIDKLVKNNYGSNSKIRLLYQSPFSHTFIVSNKDKEDVMTIYYNG
jgi:hypothetical protein